jgi:ATP/maltotriose-dependent transcriptional regulator MalT
MALRFQQKLAVPVPISAQVERLELLDQLESAIDTMRVVALAAPAGWGKTTALAQWVARSGRTIAWYTLDRTDRDPQLFLDYLLHAIVEIVPGADELAHQLAAISPQALEDIFRQVALAIAAAPVPFVLVLDDLHALDDPPGAALQDTALIREFLVALIDYAPNCQLVLSSRTLVSLFSLERLVRLGAQQRATVLDYKALQFSTAETQLLAELVSGDALPADRAERLVADLNGWVAGLVLSLSQTFRAEGLADLDTADSAAPMHAFFSEQILAPLAPELQRFLEDTSVLEDLSIARCDQLRAAHDSAQFLQEIANRVLFVSRRAGWLTYHSLFRDFLRVRLAGDPTRERALLRRAGDLYHGEEQLERALDCYLATNDLDLAIELLRQAIPRFRERSRHSTLLTCFERLSAAFAQRGRARPLPPDLLLAQARIYSDMALWEHAAMALQLAETIGEAETYAEARVLEADICCMRHDPDRAQELLDELQPEGFSPRIQLLFRFTAGRAQILRGQLVAAIASLEQALAIAPQIIDSATDPSLLAMIYDSLGWAYGAYNKIAQSIRHLQRADACWQASGNHGRRAMTLNNLGMMALADQRYSEARAALETGLELAQQTARRREETFLSCSLADLDALEGHLGRAYERFAAAHRLAVRIDLGESVATASVGAFWLAALQGRLAAANEWYGTSEAVGSILSPEARARKALGRALVLLQQPGTARAALVDQAAIVETLADALQPLERACLSLLQATIALGQGGWNAAGPAWERFEQQAAQLPDIVLDCFATPFASLFEIAARGSPLARRLYRGQAAQVLHWRVSALGAFVCQIDSAICDLSPLHQALLVRLLDAGPQGVSVERLWADVWGDSFLSMPTLHQTLYRFRSQTKLPVKVRDGICAIRSEWQSIGYDVQELEQQLAAPLTADTIRQVMALYRGDFLPGAPLSAALWADARRSFLQQRYLDALDQFAHAIEADAPEQAILCYQQILQMDGSREQTAASLMRLAIRLGNRSLVHATFEHLIGALRTLGAAPQPSTTSLYRQFS